MSLPNTRISTHRQSTARAAATAAPKKKSKLRNRDINTTTYA
ncbi:hypothetical protein UUU_32440 [Klebsiella pneumoniae subsp. pneumoniae DSM 30104 = JCM 1662 = NBRC 14940]|nr:hypothetical protein UUU_32440 [Klebsiella pneumoniae subsp. pneumoniae DSM 30104 = JCM 1662 = NBRC 14940]